MFIYNHRNPARVNIRHQSRPGDAKPAGGADRKGAGAGQRRQRADRHLRAEDQGCDCESVGRGRVAVAVRYVLSSERATDM